MFEKYNINILQALIFNYITAGICSYFFLESDFSLEYILRSGWLLHAIVIGTLFIIVFVFYGFGTQKVGISITTVANKMSLIIPVFAAIILYEDVFTYLKALAFLFAFAGIYLSFTRAGKLSFNRKYLWLIILIFLGQGISDAIFNDFAQNFPNEKGYLFFMTLFAVASVSGLLIYILKSSIQQIKTPLQLKNIFWGITFGVPNFFSLVFFLKALANPSLNSSEAFTLVSVGVVVSSTLLGVLLFNEKISKTNWIGIFLCVCAIYIFQTNI
jgi:drug/metabolite transporter (DMT)-like permease